MKILVTEHQLKMITKHLTESEKKDDKEDEEESKSFSAKYKSIQKLLDNDIFNHSAIIKELWGSKDATNRSLFRRKLNRMKNDFGSEYKFEESELDKILSIVRGSVKA
jgi:hypothetical protein